MNRLTNTDVDRKLTRNIDRVTRYGWKMKDQPGELRMLNKTLLQIHPIYQRDASAEKILNISNSFSWLAFGALVVGHRDGEFWVIDGQHRALAAQRRSDVTHVPCVVFQTDDVQQEAQGFLDLNTGRKPVTAMGKFKAMVAAGDEVAVFVKNTLIDFGLELTITAKSVNTIKCVGWCITRASENRQAFVEVLALAADLSRADNIPVSERLLGGLWYLNNSGDGLQDKRLRKRIFEKGAQTLVDAATRATAYFGRGGGKVWATGIVNELNKGLVHKFVVDGLDL